MNIRLGHIAPVREEMSAKAVANYFLILGRLDRIAITPLKIQKLVYISHGWHLALTGGQPLVYNELAEAWPYGPVFPSLYHEFKQFEDSSPITNFAEEIVLHRSIQDGELHEEYEVTDPVVENREARELLDKIWEIYRNTPGPDLSAITHAKGTPWDIVKQNFRKIKNASIPNDVIQKYYEDLMQTNEN